MHGADVGRDMGFCKCRFTLTGQARFSYAIAVACVHPQLDMACSALFRFGSHISRAFTSSLNEKTAHWHALVEVAPLERRVAQLAPVPYKLLD